MTTKMKLTFENGSSLYLNNLEVEEFERHLTGKYTLQVSPHPQPEELRLHNLRFDSLVGIMNSKFEEGEESYNWDDLNDMTFFSKTA